MKTSLSYSPITGLYAFIYGALQVVKDITNKGHHSHFRNSVIKGFEEIEKTNNPVQEVVVGPEIQKMLRFVSHRDYDPCTNRDELKTGYIGTLWGAKVFQKKGQENTITLNDESSEPF